MFLFGNPRSRHPSSILISPCDKFTTTSPSTSSTHILSLYFHPQLLSFLQWLSLLSLVAGDSSLPWYASLRPVSSLFPPPFHLFTISCHLAFISGFSPLVSVLLTSYPDSRILFYCLFSGPLAMGICRLQPPPRYHHYHHHHHYHQHRHQPSRHHAGKRS